MVMDVQGNLVTRVSLAPDLPITGLVWNCEKFNMEERDDTVNPFVDNRFSSRLAILAVCFKNGKNLKVRGLHYDRSKRSIRLLSVDQCDAVFPLQET